MGRKGLKRKCDRRRSLSDRYGIVVGAYAPPESHRICIGKSEELERKARFFAKQKMRAVSFGTSSLNKRIDRYVNTM
jgi:hypothetical protein